MKELEIENLNIDEKLTFCQPPFVNTGKKYLSFELRANWSVKILL